MRKIFALVCLLLGFLKAFSQLSDGQLDEFEKLNGTEAKSHFLFKYYPITKDSTEEKLTGLNKILKQCQDKKDLCETGIVNYVMGYHYLVAMEDYTNSLRYEINGLQNFEQCGDSVGIMRTSFIIGSALQYSRNHAQAVLYFKKGIPIARKFASRITYAHHLNAVADCFLRMKKPDSALHYVREALKIGFEEKDTANFLVFLATLGELHLLNKSYDSAKIELTKSLSYALRYNETDAVGMLFNNLAEFYYDKKDFDSAINYARRAMPYSAYQSVLMDSYEWLYKSFEKKNNADSASRYFKLAVDIRGSIFSRENNSAAQSINFQQQLWEKEKQQELIQAKKDFNNRLILYIIAAIMLIILITSAMLYRNNQRQKLARAKIEAAYAELKSTQAQLIQSEKMASLGQLTAGIAHEIQNPLNFVNNFSEVNKEMLEELKAERLKPKKERDDQTEEDILNDVLANSEKINHHGKRADAIVKGMLQHSQISTGQKESTDINALCNEYLRLAYQSLRAKDNDFNVTMKTDFDASFGEINIIPQDIGRVLLNLYNNAFYAVSQRHASTGSALKEGKEYEPTVSVSTKKDGDKVLISVKDNGTGIPQKIVDKIFQPFFTTKPTGQGTGLGLSLSYDIVKAHEGEIKVESKEREGTIFKIALPTT